MRYGFKCVNPTCEHHDKEFDHQLPMSVVGTKREPPTFCPFCGKQAERLITVGGGFILKGFEGWAGKVSKTKRDRKKRSEELEVRQYDRYGLDGGCKMVPNYKGEVMSNWKEVKKAAESDALDLGTPVDPMFDHAVYKEDILKTVTTKSQATVPATPSAPAIPTRVVAKAKKVKSIA